MKTCEVRYINFNSPPSIGDKLLVSHAILRREDRCRIAKCGELSAEERLPRRSIGSWHRYDWDCRVLWPKRFAVSAEHAENQMEMRPISAPWAFKILKAQELSDEQVWPPATYIPL